MCSIIFLKVVNKNKTECMNLPLLSHQGRQTGAFSQWDINILSHHTTTQPHNHTTTQPHNHTYRFSLTSDSGTVKKHVQLGWDFDLAADFNVDIANAMVSQLRGKLVAWSKTLEGLSSKTPFCVKADCTDAIISVVDYQKNFRISIDIDGVA